MVVYEGRALNRMEDHTGYFTLSNSECHMPKYSRQTVGANIHGQEGNNPDHNLRSQNND